MSRRIRVALVGWGSVSRRCLANQVLVGKSSRSRCARAVERAQERVLLHACPSLKTTGDDVSFEMAPQGEQGPSALDKEALEAGKRLFKPFSGTVEEGEGLRALATRRGVRLLGAPGVVLSPPFRFTAETLLSGRFGNVHVARACCGDEGPSEGIWLFATRPRGGVPRRPRGEEPARWGWGERAASREGRLLPVRGQPLDRRGRRAFPVWPNAWQEAARRR